MTSPHYLEKKEVFTMRIFKNVTKNNTPSKQKINVLSVRVAIYDLIKPYMLTGPHNQHRS